MTIDTDAVRHAGSGVTIRGFRTGDEIPILEAMLEAHARGELDGMEPYQLRHAVDGIALDPGACAVAEADGVLAGWIIPPNNDLTVLPAFRRRGIGRQLLETGRGMVAADGGDRLRLWVPRRPGAEAFAERCGLAYTSSLWQMRLTDEALLAVPEPQFPAETTVRALRLGGDEAPFVELVNRIFLDHPSPVHLSEEQLRGRHAEPDFDPATVLVVEDEAGAMVAFCRVHAFVAEDGRPSGEIRLLGVDRPWRGRGLGQAVTEWGVAELRRRGAESVMLAVEGRNEGALRLYANLGFRFRTEWRHWTIAAQGGS
jgi:mycothiol synthase